MNRYIRLCLVVLLLLSCSNIWASQFRSLYLTGNTIFIDHQERYASNLQPVSDGIFGLSEFNNKTYSMNWGFWTIEGKCLFAAEWEQHGDFRPRFNSGACVVQKSGTKTPVILYSNGAIKELSKEWSVTQFEDGVAMVTEILDWRTVNLYYINTKGEKIYGHLSKYAQSGPKAAVIRPINCNRRPFYSSDHKLWGLLDENGNVIVEPTYQAIRDFVNGYSLVMVGESYETYKLYFIDINGKQVCEVKPQNNASAIDYANRVSDVSDNDTYCISDGRGENTQYYSLHSNEVLHTVVSGMSFFSGLAFVIPEGGSLDDPPYIINSKFDKVGRWTFKYSDFAYKKPHFSPVGLVTVGGERVLNAMGEIIIDTPRTWDTFDLGDYSKDGYIPFVATFKVDDEDIDIAGYADTNGEVKIALYKQNVFRKVPIIEEPEPEPEDPPQDTIPIIFPEPPPGPPYILPKDSGGMYYFILADTTPEGPIEIEKVRYNVNVAAYPPEGGTVYGSGQYQYGDIVRVTGTPAKDWKLSKIVCDRKMGATTDVFNLFNVVGDMNITCYFVEDVEPEPPTTTCYRGSLPFPTVDKGTLQIPIWLELSNEGTLSTPYGENTYGYLTLCFNPDEILHVKNSDGSSEVFYNCFMTPMLVKGITTDKETGKQYLMIDGGEIVTANMMVKDIDAETGKPKGFNTLLANLLLAFDSYTEISITPARYRIEILNGTIGDDNFTFGGLERLSATHGWMPGGDDIFKETSKGLFVRAESRGLDYNMLNGFKMQKSSDRPQVWWYPTNGFYGLDDQSKLNEIVEKLGETYREFTVDIDILQNYNLQDFSTDLDNNLFKPASK